MMRMALIAMPWFWAHMPSIQLAIVKDILGQSKVRGDVFEFYADFADLVGSDLYGMIANTGTFIGERLFSQFYYPELRDQPIEEISHLLFNDPAIERDILRFATPLVEEYLDRCVEEVSRTTYDAVCFTLTAQQVGASMAMAQRLRSRRPDLPIIVGGAACAGDMGRAILEICAEFSVAVHGEAESILPGVVAALQGTGSWEDIDGISWRRGDGEILTSQSPKMHIFQDVRKRLNFDAYFERIKSLPTLCRLPSWVPFESSRGCWYGEKSQCTFCGLNEIIKFRQRDTSRIFDELSYYADRYQLSNFFAVDLIMPRTFHTDFLPQVIEAGKDWTIFYEVKSNMRRAEVEMLAKAGVRWIQPGIESLSDHVLKLMRKGVTAAHNIQTLRLATEMEITVSWNLICNFPQEVAGDYYAMGHFFPHLHHLDPPSGLAPFEVHRFSPFHEQPAQHGVALRGAHKTYEAVFPVSGNVLERLVYRFEYELLRPNGPDLVSAHGEVMAAVTQWKAARERGARFDIEYHDDGTSTLRDTRSSSEPRLRHMSAAETSLLSFLEEMQPLVRLAHEFATADPAAYRALGKAEGVEAAVERFRADGTILTVSGVALTLATRKRPADIFAPTSVREMVGVAG